jgi:predicted nucleic acid-binding protein
VIVVDSNVVVARNLEHEGSALAREVERRDPGWIVPPLWRYEFQNVLVKALWAQRLSVAAALEVWAKASAAIGENEGVPNPVRVLELSARHHVTAYDASFVALALDLGVQCVTEDAELLEKFPGIAVSMAGFVGSAGGAGEVREELVSYRVRRPRKQAAAARAAARRGPRRSRSAPA